MAENEIGDYFEVDNDNTDIAGISMQEGVTRPPAVNNAFRAVQGALKRWFKTSLFRLRDSTDQTKLLAFDLSSIPTATTQTFKFPSASGTLALTSNIQGHISGLTLSNNVSDTTNDIDIAVGSAVDNSGSVSMVLASGLTKRLDATWAVGNNQGMLASGAVLANATYHIFLIRRPDTGVVDIAADTSVTGANIAANTNAAYTQIRRIGSIMRKSGAIVQFVQYVRKFLLSTPTLDISISNPGIAPTTRVLNVPTGLNVKWFGSATLVDTSPTSATALYIYNPGQSDTVSPTPGSIGQVQTAGALAGGVVASSYMEILTDTSAQVKTQLSLSDADIFLRLFTAGWGD